MYTLGSCDELGMRYRESKWKVSIRDFRVIADEFGALTARNLLTFHATSLERIVFKFWGNYSSAGTSIVYVYIRVCALIEYVNRDVRSCCTI